MKTFAIEYDFSDFRVISGAQTGVDQAALEAAHRLGISTGGFCPAECRTTDGPRPDLISKYGLTETEKNNYQFRTKKNVEASNGTLRIAWHLDSPGEKLTYQCVKQLHRPLFDIDLNSPGQFQDAVQWIKMNGILVLNVAGNSERTAPGIYQQAFPILTQIFEGVIS